MAKDFSCLAHKDTTTGLDEIDQDHRLIVDAINALGEHTRSTSFHGIGSVRESINAVIAATEQHVAHESSLFDTYHIDPRHTKTHISSHRNALRHLRLLASYHAAMSVPAEAIFTFLRHWFAAHVNMEDCALATQVAHIRSGMTPEAAYALAETTVPELTSPTVSHLQRLIGVLLEVNQDLASANQLLDSRVMERTREIELLSRRIDVLTRTDGLLGIPNRIYFDDHIAIEWRLARRQKAALSLLLLDIDAFHAYNECYGHSEGDLCLQIIAKITQEALFRPTDFVARFGGDTIVVLLPDTQLDGARIVADRIQAGVHAKALGHARSSIADRVSVSIGGACSLPSVSTDPDALLLAAEMALSQAQHRGGNTVVVRADLGSS